MKIILQKKGLLLQNRKLRLDCETGKKKEDKEHYGTFCCAKQLLYLQPNFQSQRSPLQEEIEAQRHLCLFFSKYHYKLNWIEYCWNRSKWWARKYYRYNWKTFHRVVSKSLHAVSNKMILRYYNKTQHILKAYRDEVKYRTE